MRTTILTAIMLAITMSCSALTNISILQVQPVGTIADLRTTHPSTIGSWAYVSGYYSVSDGGGGSFFYDATSASGDNGGTIIAPTGYSTGRWIRKEQSPANVLWFGAKGDWASSSAAINTAAIKAAVASGKPTYIPAGLYYVNDTIEVTGPIYGDGKEETILVSLCDAKPLFRVGAGGHQRISSMQMVGQGDYDALVVGTATPVASETCIQINLSGGLVTLEDLWIRNFQSHGVAIEPAGEPPTGFVVRSCRIKNNYGDGIKVTNANMGKISENSVTFNKGWNINATASSLIVDNNILSTWRAMQTDGAAIQVAAASSNTGRVQVIYNHIEDDGSDEVSVATASRKMLCKLGNCVEFRGNYMRTIPGWINNLVEVNGVECYVDDNSFRTGAASAILGLVQPTSAIRINTVIGVDSLPVVGHRNNYIFGNTYDSIFSASSTAYFVQERPTISYVLPITLDFNGTALASVAVPLPEMGKVYSLQMIYTSASSIATFSNGDLIIGTAEGLSDIYSSIVGGASALRSSYPKGSIRAIEDYLVTKEWPTSGIIYISYQQRSGQTLKGQLRLRAYK